MHGYPSGTQSTAPGATPVEEVEAPAASSSVSTRSRGNVIAAATVPFKAPAKWAAPVDSEVSSTPLFLMFCYSFSP